MDEVLSSIQDQFTQGKEIYQYKFSGQPTLNILSLSMPFSRRGEKDLFKWSIYQQVVLKNLKHKQKFTNMHLIHVGKHAANA